MAILFYEDSYACQKINHFEYEELLGDRKESNFTLMEETKLVVLEKKTFPISRSLRFKSSFCHFISIVPHWLQVLSHFCHLDQFVTDPASTVVNASGNQIVSLCRSFCEEGKDKRSIDESFEE